MRFLAIVLLCGAATVAAAEPPASAAPQQPPAVEATAVRVAVVKTEAAEPLLTVPKPPAVQGWLLLLSGLALAGWIAHRRLSYL